MIHLSDTHNYHKKLNVPSGDLLIHSGDFTSNGQVHQIVAFDKWLGEIKHKFKFGILICAGNHDRLFETDPNLARSLITNATYLQDEAIEINGFKIYLSPHQPEFCNWSFNVPRGEALAKIWAKIPLDTDILVTHGPARGILDYAPQCGQVGCNDLYRRILELPNLLLHCFGHIHASWGTKMVDNVMYSNGSICNEQYKPINKPNIFRITKRIVKQLKK